LIGLFFPHKIVIIHSPFSSDSFAFSWTGRDGTSDKEWKVLVAKVKKLEF
jgi:hypothetical protein